MINNLPPISILIPTYNEEGFIEACLQSLVAGNYRPDLLEILIIDGGSTDETRMKAASVPLHGARLKILDNPRKVVPSAMNIGLREAEHDIVIWLGAHAIYDADYLRLSVQTLLKENCASVGGILKPIGTSTMGKAIARATASKFGIGNAKYRFASRQQEVDTVFGGCWRKSEVLRIGGFNEQWVRNQDYELNQRLRSKVGPIILNPHIKCQYYCRDSLSSLAKQYFGYGYWRFRTVMKYKSSFTVRLATPLLLLISLIISAALASTLPVLASVVPTVYVATCVVLSAVYALQDRSFAIFFLLPAIFMTIHISWAAGFLLSSVDYLMTKLKAKTQLANKL